MHVQFSSGGSCSMWANGHGELNPVQPMVQQACNWNTLASVSSGHKHKDEKSGVTHFHATLLAGFRDTFPLNCLSCARSSSNNGSGVCCAT